MSKLIKRILLWIRNLFSASIKFIDTPYEHNPEVYSKTQIVLSDPQLGLGWIDVVRTISREGIYTPVFVINRKGKVYKLYDPSHWSYLMDMPEEYSTRSVGVELVSDSSDTEYTKPQLKSLKYVILYIGDKFDIPIYYNDNMWSVYKKALSGKKGVWGRCSFTDNHMDHFKRGQLSEFLKGIHRKKLNK